MQPMKVKPEDKLSQTSSWLVHAKIQKCWTDRSWSKTWKNLSSALERKERMWIKDGERKEDAKELCTPINVWSNILHKEADHQCQVLQVEDRCNSVDSNSMPVRNPNEHIKSFLGICDSQKHNGVLADTVHLLLFPSQKGIKQNCASILCQLSQLKHGKSWSPSSLQSTFHHQKWLNYEMRSLP